MGSGQGMLQANDHVSCACAGSRSPHWGVSALVAHFVACTNARPPAVGIASNRSGS